MHKWLPNLVAKFWIPNLVLYQTAYGVNLLTPINFHVLSVNFVHLMAKYLAKNGVSGTFWKKYWLNSFHTFWCLFILLFLVWISASGCQIFGQKIFLDKAYVGVILSPSMGTASLHLRKCISKMCLTFCSGLNVLSHFGPVMPCSIIDIGQHWQQACTWTHVTYWPALCAGLLCCNFFGQPGSVSKFPPLLWVKLWVGWVGRGYTEISRYFPASWINWVTLVTKIKLLYSLRF